MINREKINYGISRHTKVVGRSSLMFCIYLLYIIILGKCDIGSSNVAESWLFNLSNTRNDYNMKISIRPVINFVKLLQSRGKKKNIEILALYRISQEVTRVTRLSISNMSIDRKAFARARTYALAAAAISYASSFSAERIKKGSRPRDLFCNY